MEQAAPRPDPLWEAFRLLLAGTFVDLAALIIVVFAHALAPSPGLVSVGGGLVGVLAALAVGSLAAGVGWAWKAYPQRHRTMEWVALLTLATLLAHLYIIGSPSSYVGDESFYIPEAQGILAGTQCTLGSCHMEHPLLVPGMIAGAMAIFGPDSPVGWRLVSVLLGTFTVPVTFGIAWKASKSEKMALLSAVLLSLDVMFFTQSGTGFLDTPEVFFGMAAFLAYFAKVRWRRVDEYLVAGVFLGLAGLSKETAIFMVAALLSFILLFGEGSWKERARAGAKTLAAVVLVFIVGLQAFDSTLASSAAPTFLQQISYILSYGSGLLASVACQPIAGAGYFCKYAAPIGHPPILPTDWLVFYTPTAYFRSVVTVNPGNISFVGLGYYGVTNFIETWSVFVWLPLLAYLLYGYLKSTGWSLAAFRGALGADPASVPGEVRFAALVLVMFFWAYVPYLFLFVGGRVTYPFYLLPGIPAVAMGGAYWLSRDWFPRFLVYVYILAAFLFFFIYFPDKGFLPDWLRAIIAH